MIHPFFISTGLKRGIPATGPRLDHQQRRGGFTIIELLVTMGIIVILMAILIPVVAAARKAAQTASTTNEIQKISAAINNYYQDFGAYPGVVSNAAFAAGTATAFPSSLAKYTQSEDLVMALLGGLSAPGYPTLGFTLAYDTTKAQGFVGTGPMTYNVSNPAKRLPYLQMVASELPADFSRALLQIPELSYCTDTVVPEFLDLYSSPRPILYIRANPGAKTGAGNIVYDSSTTNTFNANAFYDLRGTRAYLNSNDTLIKAATDSGVVSFFTNTSGTAKFAGSYILISAGGNRTFGDTDDIVYGGGGGQ